MVNQEDSEKDSQERRTRKGSLSLAAMRFLERAVLFCRAGNRMVKPKLKLFEENMWERTRGRKLFLEVWP